MADPTADTSEQLISSMPEDVVKFYASAFKRLEALPEEVVEPLRQKLPMVLVQAGVMESPFTLAASLDFPESDEAIFAMFLIATMGSRASSTPTGPIEQLRSKGVIGERSAHTERLMSTVQENSSGVSKALQTTRLISAVLPAYERVEIGTDIRLAFEANKITNTVPVGLVVITSDAPEHDTFIFQIGQRQLRGLIEKLQQLDTRLGTAAEWLAERT